MNRPDEEFQPIWAVGFMTGTSIDAVDAAMIKTDGEQIFDLGPVAEVTYGTDDRRTIQVAVEAARAWNWQGEEPGAPFRAAEAVAARLHGVAFNHLMEGWSGPAPRLAGVHGQTVLHRAPQAGQRGATRQIVDAQAICEALDLPVVYDFRSADIAAGGEGAPLAPAYHGALLGRLGAGDAAVLNLGGVANITASDGAGGFVAFDTGPANGPVDEWVEGHGLGTYDEEGRLAAAGRPHEGLLSQWLDHPYFEAPPPKSLDRFDFNASMARGLSPQDGAATLTALSARAVARGITFLPSAPSQILVCGGGRRNPVLMAMLQAELGCPVTDIDRLGARGDSVEAEAFAFLAVRHLRGLPISWPSTTSVPEPMTGGRRFPADP